MVFYRKYRPQSLEDLVGQESIKTALLSALKGDKLSHAYLFCGPRGTGKTSTARILAKMVNCSQNQKPGTNDQLPCNSCSSCTSISDGSNLDLIEIDAASNRGIEDIRSLRENIKLAPTSSKKKVYIIDEVHMLTTEAFNALLKTLEEPPSHALFILATTDPEKIPATILSRVTRLDFKLASVDDLKTALKKIAESEKLNIDNKILTLLAKKANGSYRDGIKLLDQVTTLEDLSLAKVTEALLASENQQVFSLLKTIAQKDSQSALTTTLDIINSGVAIKDLTLGLLDSLRQIVLIKNGLGERMVKAELSPEDYTELVGISESFTADQLILSINSIQASLEKARYVSIPSLPLEIALIESCLASQASSSSVSPNPPSTPSLPSIPSPQVLTTHVSLESHVSSEDSLPITAVPSIGASEDLQKIAEKWQVVLDSARSFNYSLEALLRSSKVNGVEGRVVIFEVPYAFHQRMLETPKSRDFIEMTLKDILGRDIQIKVVVGKKPQKNLDEVSNVELAADDEIVRIASEIFAADVVN